MEPRVLVYVSSPTSTEPTGAADWSRAAVFTTSPAIIASPCPGRASSSTIASPVFTAMRTWRPSSSAQSRTANAARTARSGSSPYAVGAPKTPMTASPMNFSTAAAEPLELRADPLVVRREDVADVLGVELLGARGEADEVDEEHGHDPPLLAASPGVASGRAARVAELRVLGVRLTTACTGRHDRED